MKFKIFLILVWVNILHGQENKAKIKANFNPEISLYLIGANNFGNNYLAKTNDSNISIGTNVKFIDVQRFKLGLGYDHIGYSVTDVSKAGNYKRSSYTAFYGTLGYEIKLSNELYIRPYLGYGSVKLNFKSGNRSFGHQTGTDFRFGFNVGYKLDRTISAFTGLGFVASNYGIKTAPEFVSFYDNSKMLQINVGIKLN